MDNRPIGMFDSGVGGITVLKEVKEKLPNEKVIYLGDTKRFPYGAKTRETIIELTKRGIDFLIEKDAKIIIIACGTATSQALEEVRKIYKIPIIGIIEPTIEYLKEQDNIKRIGVMATAGTIRSKGWENAIRNYTKDVEIINKACPLLAPMAEEGWTENEIAKLTIKEYIKGIEQVDELILGCTHYPLFKKLIQEEVSSNTKIINTGEMVAKYLKKYIAEEKMQADETENQYHIYLTETENNFKTVANQLLKEPIHSIEKIDI